MTHALYITAICVFAVWQLWIGFVAIMHMRHVRDEYGLTLTQKAFGYPALAVYYLLDVALRLTVFAVLFVRPPKLETVSALLEREATEGSGWRKAFAYWMREDLLADFDDKGGHGEPGR